MDETELVRYITGMFAGVDVVTADGDHYFFFDPEHMFPFATLVTGDRHDTVSDLNRPSVFRLNVGVSKETFRALFDPEPAEGGAGYDYTALDRIMPHPVYGKMYWVCVLNPGPATLETVRPLLAEAYNLSVKKQERKRAAGGTADPANPSSAS